MIKVNQLLDVIRKGDCTFFDNKTKEKITVNTDELTFPSFRPFVNEDDYRFCEVKFIEAAEQYDLRVYVDTSTAKRKIVTESSTFKPSDFDRI